MNKPFSFRYKWYWVPHIQSSFCGVFERIPNPDHSFGEYCWSVDSLMRVSCLVSSINYGTIIWLRINMKQSSKREVNRTLSHIVVRCFMDETEEEKHIYWFTYTLQQHLQELRSWFGFCLESWLYERLIWVLNICIEKWEDFSFEIGYSVHRLSNPC